MPFWGGRLLKLLSSAVIGETKNVNSNAKRCFTAMQGSQLYGNTQGPFFENFPRIIVEGAGYTEENTVIDNFNHMGIDTEYDTYSVVRVCFLCNMSSASHQLWNCVLKLRHASGGICGGQRTDVLGMTENAPHRCSVRGTLCKLLWQELGEVRIFKKGRRALWPRYHLRKVKHKYWGFTSQN